MTSIAATSAQTHIRDEARHRIWNVVRLHYANRWNSLALPWLVIGIVFAINIAIWLIILISSNGHASLADTKWAGSTFYIFVYMAILAILAMNLTFQFALGFSVTRRDYYLGTALMFLVQAVGFTLFYLLLSYVEEWTGGWWVGGHMFNSHYFGSGPFLQRAYTILAAFLVCFFIGGLFGAVFVRWRVTGLMTVGLAIAVLVVAGIAVVTLSHNWPAVWSWFAHAGTTGFVSVLLIPAAISAVAGYFVLRRATPRG
jgi:hypothetical protein